MMEMKWHFFHLFLVDLKTKGNVMSTTTESKIRIQLENFSVSDEIETMKKVSRNIGGITTFLGTGRELSKGQNIAQLNFEHYPKMAEKKLEEIRQQAIKDHGIIDMSIIHRIGPIEIGENIVLIVAVGEHRKEIGRASCRERV